MGTRLQDIVNVTISRETAKLTLVGFGTPLLLGETSRIFDRVVTYSDTDGMLADGFSESDNLYKMAVALMSQERSPEQFKIGRKYANVNAKQQIVFTGTATAGTWTVTLAGATTAGIAYDAAAAAVKSAIEALASVTEVTVTGTMGTGFVIEFTGADVNKHFDTFSVSIASLTGVTAVTVTVLQYGSATETWATALSGVRAFDDSWYCLLADTRVAADIEALADAIEPLLKIYVACSSDADVITSVSSDIASILKGKSLDRTALLWSKDDANFPDAAWVGLQLPKDPGSTTWKFKTLAGITADDITASEVGYLKTKQANFYEEIAGVSVVSGEGVVASGEYIDVMHGSDWLQTRIAERIFSRLINSEKIPFTTQGISVIEAEIRYQLGKGVDAGFLAAGSAVVTVPDIENVDPLEKAARYLNGITFSATLAGAVHKATISGKLSV
ncbi:MAG: DUF3383 family protein [bacterium]